MRRILGFGAKSPPQATPHTVKQKFDSFMRLLSENHVALRVIAELQERAGGDDLFEIGYLRLNVETLSASVRTMIQQLDRLSGGQYPRLLETYRELDGRVTAELTQRRPIPEDALTIPLSEITQERADSVGGKTAHLGEMRNRLGLPVPDGCAVSAYAYKRFIEDSGLAEEIDDRLASLDTNDLAELEAASRWIQECIQSKDLPADLHEALTAGCTLLQGRGGIHSLAVRSSAVGEGIESSFAGQYATFLNVPCTRLPEMYKEIVASKFAPRALFYLTNRGFRQEEIAMSVCCVEMIPARSSGVLCTTDPIDPGSDTMIINSRWGLGRALVTAGSLPPDFFRVSKADGEVVEQRIAHQERQLVVRAEGEGVEAIPVPEALREAPSLEPGQLRILVDHARRLEEHYGVPQDVEWVVDLEDRVFLTQTRKLALTPAETRGPRPDLSRYPLLLAGGDRASPGVGHGRVVLVERDEDLRRFPTRGVLVSRTTSTRFVTVMNKTSAIITDEGRAAGHMASLAREFRVPALVNTRVAREVLQPGMEVTVDATQREVYEGRVDELLRQPGTRRGIFKDTPAYAALQRILPDIAPLHLVDPAGQNFTQDACRSFHDLTRFCHQKAMQEMYRLAEEAARHMDQACRIRASIPLDVYVLDLGGGVEGTPERVIEPERITSLPMHAFWAGLTSIAWPAPKPTVKGFLSVVAHTVADPELQKRLEEKSLAIISREYMNFSLRLGYHLSTVEGLLTPAREDSYLRFYFHGGAASAERRLRRARLVERIVDHYGFHVHRQGETVEAILTQCDRETLEKHAEMLGRLTVYTKQLDMAMFNDSIVDVFAEEFLHGQYARPHSGEKTPS